MIGVNRQKTASKWRSKMMKLYTENPSYWKKILGCQTINDVMTLKVAKLYKKTSSIHRSKKSQFEYRKENRKRRHSLKQIPMNEISEDE